MSDLIVVGTTALDSIETPHGNYPELLGGSGVHASMAARFFVKPYLISIVGEDFSKKYLDFLSSQGIETKGVEVIKGQKTFHWEGYYEKDMSQAFTRKTDLNVLMQFDPEVPENIKSAKVLFLANIDPDLQRKVIAQVSPQTFKILDSMNFWIESKKAPLLEVMKQVDLVILNDAEIKQLTSQTQLISAAKELIAQGVKRLVIKKGEHGVLLVTANDFFMLPGFPVDRVVDPTGAGDSFAGAFAGYLALKNQFDFETFKKAAVLGNLIASFNVEDFSMHGLKALEPNMIEARFKTYHQFITFEKDIF